MDIILGDPLVGLSAPLLLLLHLLHEHGGLFLEANADALGVLHELFRAPFNAGFLHGRQAGRRAYVRAWGEGLNGSHGEW